MHLNAVQVASTQPEQLDFKMGEQQWRVVDTPLMQPQDLHMIVFADWGPWCTNFQHVVRNALWLERIGREVWIEGMGKTWFNTQGQLTQGPPQYYRKKPKGDYG